MLLTKPREKEKKIGSPASSREGTFDPFDVSCENLLLGTEVNVRLAV